MALKFDMSKGDWKRDYAMQQMANQGVSPYHQAGQNLVHAAGFAAPVISKFVKEKAIPGISKFAEEFPGKAISTYKGINPYILNEAGRKAYKEAPHGLTEQEWIDKVRSGDKEFDTGSTEKYLQRKLPFTRKGALERALFPKLGAKKGIDKFLQKTDPMAHLFPLHGEGIKEKLFPQQGQKIRDFMSDPKGAINKKLFPNEGAQFWGSPLGRTLDAAKTKIEGIPAERRRRKRARLRPDTPISDAEPEFYDASYNMIETPEFEQFDEWEQPAKRPTPAPIQEEYDRSQERKHGIKYVEPKKNIFGKEKKGPLQTVIQPNFKKMGFNNLEEMNSSFSQAREINPNLSWKDFTKLAEEGKLEDYLLTPSVTPSNFQLGPM
tara:strand:+ start:862 stop:1995 length:1134 start_codon:yes stop_codon:yes gene_type:complete